MLWIGFEGSARATTDRAPRSRSSRSRCLFLIAFRVALNIADSGVIDVGYAV